MDVSIKAMTARDLEETLMVTRTALECNKVDELRCEALRLLEKVFKTESSNFFLSIDPDQRINLDHVISRGIEERFLTQFRQYYYQLDPFLKISYLPPSPVVLTTEQVIPFKDLIRGEYYNDFLRHQSIHYQMTIWLRRKNRVLGILALFRPRKARGFSSADKAKAHLMAPYLAGALDRTIIAGKTLMRESIIDTIIADLPYKVIMVLDDSLEPIYQNDNVLSILSRLSQAGKGQQPSLVSAVPKEVYPCCKRLLASGRGDTILETDEGQYHLVSTADAQKISIHLRLVKSRGNPLVFLCVESDKHIEALFQRLKEWGLSRRECDVVFLLSKGLKNKEIGEKLFISPCTVDNHLKSIYRKMGVTNRTAAARRLMEMTSNIFPLMLSSHS
jgi:DNA-binding CsgD family transcriptional regulator